LNDLSFNVSSADQLLAYLRSKDDIKGLQRKETSSNISSGSIYDRWATSQDCIAFFYKYVIHYSILLVEEMVVEETSTTVGLFQEVIMSPMSSLMSPATSSTQLPSYRDCLKAFNFVFNYCQTQKNGSSKFLSSIWETYNTMVSSSRRVGPTNGNIASFPEVHTTPTYSRQRTAGYLWSFKLVNTILEISKKYYIDIKCNNQNWISFHLKSTQEELSCI
jgi:hypothetical protein